MNSEKILEMKSEKSHEKLGNFPKNQESVAFFEGKSWLGNQSKEFTCARWVWLGKLGKREKKSNWCLRMHSRVYPEAFLKKMFIWAKIK